MPANGTPAARDLSETRARYTARPWDIAQSPGAGEAAPLVRPTFTPAASVPRPTFTPLRTAGQPAGPRRSWDAARASDPSLARDAGPLGATTTQRTPGPRHTLGPPQHAAGAQGTPGPQGSPGPQGALGAQGAPTGQGAPEAQDTRGQRGSGARSTGQFRSAVTGGFARIADTTGPIVRQAGTRLAALHARQRRKFWRELPVLVVIAIALALVIKTYAVQAFYIPSGSMQNTLGIGDRVLINKIVYHTRGIARGDIVVFNGDSTWDYADAPQHSSNPVSRLTDALEGIVGITHGSDIYIKRVIGLPGDHIRCCDAQGRVTVNGVPLTEQGYLYPGNLPSTPFPTSDGSDVVRTPQASGSKGSAAGATAGSLTVVVPPGHLWVMGDHRDVSYDSRGHMGDPGGGAIPENAVMGRAFVVIWPASKWGFLNIPATFEQPGLTSSPAGAGGSPAALSAARAGGGVPVRDAWTPLPLALGFAGAVPLTWLQRRARKRLAAVPPSGASGPPFAPGTRTTRIARIRAGQAQMPESPEGR